MIESKCITLGDIQGVSSTTKTKSIRNFTLIMSFANKIQIGFPKKSLAKEWSNFFKSESTYWSVRRKNEEELLTPTKTSPHPETDFFSLGETSSSRKTKGRTLLHLVETPSPDPAAVADFVPQN